MKTLYFAKVNYDHIYEVYDKKKKLSEITNKIFSFLSQEEKYTKIEQKKNDDGDNFFKEITYEFLGLEKENNVVIGNLIKNDYLYLKTINRETNEILKRKEENDESILFYYDVSKEIIVFHKSLRFGYLEFCEAFQNLLNQNFEANQSKETFSIGIKNNISSIESIVEDIKKLGSVKELKVDLLPPNPNKELLQKMDEDSDKVLTEMRTSNITRKSTIFTSNSEEGLNIDSDMIKSPLNDFKYLHKNLTPEDIINNYYGEVTAISKRGEKYSSQRKEPIKYQIPDSKKNKRSFKEIIGDIIISIFN